MANDDGRVVDLEHGCGAHSGVRLSRAASVKELPDPYFDTLTNDVVARPEPTPEVVEPVEAEAPEAGVTVVEEGELEAQAQAQAQAETDTEAPSEVVVEEAPVEDAAVTDDEPVSSSDGSDAS